MRNPIKLNEQLQKNDVIEIEFKTTSWLWLQSAEIAVIESYCEYYKEDWEIISNSLPVDNRITFTILVKNNVSSGVSPYQRAGLEVTCQLVANTILTAGIGISLVLLGAYLVEREGVKLIESVEKSPAGQVAMTGIGAAGIALLVFIVYKYILGK